jgi:hypothetical protein
MTCGTQYPVKASVDLKKETVFTALDVRKYLSNGCDIERP